MHKCTQKNLNPQLETSNVIKTRQLEKKFDRKPVFFNANTAMY